MLLEGSKTMKTSQKTNSAYTQNALALFAATIRGERKALKMTIKELAEKVIEISGSKSKLVYRPLPSDDPTRRRPDAVRKSRHENCGLSGELVIC